jgi:DNA-binding MarR family transcriptional regulator
MEGTDVRQRSRPTRAFTQVDNELIFGYPQLTDAERVTYLAIETFDWPDKEGSRKGYAFPAVRTLAELRRLDVRTIQRHLDALEQAGLVRREPLPGKPNRLWIEASAAERVEELSTKAAGGDADVTTTPDTAGTPYKKEEREKHKLVNGVQRTGEERRRARLTRDEYLKREWLAGEILKVCKDRHSLGFYRKVAETVPEHRVFEALSEVNQASRSMAVRAKGAFFTSIALSKGGDRARETF